MRFSTPFSVGILATEKDRSVVRFLFFQIVIRFVEEALTRSRALKTLSYSPPLIARRTIYLRTSWACHVRTKLMHSGPPFFDREYCGLSRQSCVRLLSCRLTSQQGWRTPRMIGELQHLSDRVLRTMSGCRFQLDYKHGVCTCGRMATTCQVPCVRSQ